MLDVKNITVKYGGLTIIQDINFSVPENQWLMICGPNGAGKSTLLNAISQGVDYTGLVSFDGEDVSKLKPSSLAKKMGVLMQSHHVAYSFSVEEVVRLGRYAYSQGIFSALSDEDTERINAALEVTGMTPMKDQSVLTLSGGELQRTFLAQLLAQNPMLLILDEPSNHLDLVYQKQVFDLVRDWLQQPMRAVVSVVHDLSLARAYGTHAMLLGGGRQIAYGDIDSALNNENLQIAYDMDVFGWMHEMLGQWQDR